MQKRFLIFFLIVFSSFSLLAQTISNITVEQIDTHLEIRYDLIGSPSKNCEVTAMYSLNTTSGYISISSAEGDVGKYVKPGKNKVIKWELTEETDGIIGRLNIKLEAKYVSKYSKAQIAIGYSFLITSAYIHGSQVIYPFTHPVVSPIGFQFSIFNLKDIGENLDLSLTLSFNYEEHEFDIDEYRSDDMFYVKQSYFLANLGISGRKRIPGFGWQLGGGITHANSSPEDSNATEQSESVIGATIQTGFFFNITKRTVLNLNIGAGGYGTDPLFYRASFNYVF